METRWRTLHLCRCDGPTLSRNRGARARSHRSSRARRTADGGEPSLAVPRSQRARRGIRIRSRIHGGAHRSRAADSAARLACDRLAGGAPSIPRALASPRDEHRSEDASLPAVAVLRRELVRAVSTPSQGKPGRFRRKWIAGVRTGTSQSSASRGTGRVTRRACRPCERSGGEVRRRLATVHRWRA
jgi:hypothetical protein